MSRSTIRNQLQVFDGNGVPVLSGGPWVPGAPSGYNAPIIGGIGTGTWCSRWVNVDEHRRLSITLGVTSATGAVADTGGFTGTLQVWGTDELAQCYGASGSIEAGAGSRPGINGYTGARFAQQLASGSVAITAGTSSASISFTDVGYAFVRVTFNANSVGVATATGTLGGSGTAWVYLTAKNT